MLGQRDFHTLPINIPPKQSKLSHQSPINRGWTGLSQQGNWFKQMDIWLLAETDLGQSHQSQDASPFTQIVRFTQSAKYGLPLLHGSSYLRRWRLPIYFIWWYNNSYFSHKLSTVTDWWPVDHCLWPYLGGIPSGFVRNRVTGWRSSNVCPAEISKWETHQLMIYGYLNNPDIKC